MSDKLMSDKLMELARRVEEMSGPSFLIEQEIADAVGHNPRARLPNYTASLDAAMSLVPADHALSLHVDADGSVFAGVMLDDGDGCDDARPCGATPALALCAASLRALASKGGAE